MQRTFLSLILIPLLVIMMTGCQTMATTGKVVVTPVAAVRDVVDIPLTGVASFMEKGAQQTKSSFGQPRAGAGYGLGGFTAGFGLDLSYGFAKGVSYVFGGLDYVLCRSLFPNFPDGVSPWKKKEESWGSHLFPNLKGIWGGYKNPPEEPAPGTAYQLDRSPPWDT